MLVPPLDQQDRHRRRLGRERDLTQKENIGPRKRADLFPYRTLSGVEGAFFMLGFQEDWSGRPEEEGNRGILLIEFPIPSGSWFLPIRRLPCDGPMDSHEAVASPSNDLRETPRVQLATCEQVDLFLWYGWFGQR